MTESDDGYESPAPRGADMAREALEKAKARNAAKRLQAGRSSAVGRGMAGRGRRRWSGPGPDARDPKPLGATLNAWLKTAGSTADLDKATLFGRWEQIVGPEIASRAVPINLVDGELTLQAESTAWATQIRMMAPAIMGKIATSVGSGVVKKVRAQGPTGPSWRFGPRHVSGRGPRDTYG